MLVENGVGSKKSGGGSKDKYESHTQVGDLTIIFADNRVILVKRTKVSFEREICDVSGCRCYLFLQSDNRSRLTGVLPSPEHHSYVFPPRFRVGGS